MAAVTAELELDVSSALAAVDQVEQALTEAVASVMAEVDVDASAAQAEIDSIGAEPIDVPVEADVAPAEAEIQSLDADPIEVPVNADTSAAQADLSELTDALSESNVAGTDLAGTFAGITGGGAGTAGAVGAVTAGAFALADAFGEAEAVGARTQLIIENTGGNANVTASEIAALASEIQSYSGISDEAIATGANFALGMENIRNAGEGEEAILTRLITVSADYASFTGGDVTTATQRFGRALNDPVRGLGLLRRANITFTQAQQDQITVLAESGDILGAQLIILDALEGRYQGTARTLGELSQGGFQRAQEAAGELAETLGSVVAPGLEASSEGALSLIGVLEQFGAALGDLPGVGEGSGEAGLSDALKFLTPAGLPGRVREGVDLINESISDLDGFDEAFAATARVVGEEFPKAQDGLAESTDGATEGLNAEADALDKVTDASVSLREELDSLTSSQQSVDEGAVNVRDAQRDLLEGLVDIGGRYQAGTEAGDEFLTTARDLGTAIRDQTLRLLESGAGADAARLAQAGYTEGLRATLEQAGFTDAQVQELIETYATVPEKEITQFETPGLVKAIGETAAFKKDLDSIPTYKKVTVDLVTSGSVIPIIGQINQVSSAIANLPSLNPFESGRVAGSGPVDQSSIVVNVDARGARDPVAVGDAVAEALGPHRRKLSQKLHQRAG